jgi:hypothetical protein
MSFRFNVNKYQVMTGTTYSCLLMLLVSSKLTDSAEVRKPRVAEMIDAAALLVGALGKHPDVASVKLVRPADVLFNQFDLTPKGGLNVCLPLDQPQL